MYLCQNPTCAMVECGWMGGLERSFGSNRERSWCTWPYHAAAARSSIFGLETVEAVSLSHSAYGISILNFFIVCFELDVRTYFPIGHSTLESVYVHPEAAESYAVSDNHGFRSSGYVSVTSVSVMVCARPSSLSYLGTNK
jgi:hypothetical protein